MARIAADLGISRGTFFEFGISPTWQAKSPDDLEGNFVQLRRQGWNGVFLDGKQLDPGSGVVQGFVTPLNINDVWRQQKIPHDLDFLSVDVDGQEFWIWMALSYLPKVVVVEYNGAKAVDASVTIQFDVDHVWDGTDYHGASLLALDRLGRSKGYVLVWANGVNAVFVRNHLCANKEDFDFVEIYEQGLVGLKAVHALYGPHPVDGKHRPWVEV